jgi:aerobic-type carbon monoxide dehydrogenase small subunit (CoxS/CutS family)
MAAFKVNGKRYDPEVDPATPLLWVLRESLGLTGAKYGCGVALCGACTVHVDGQATRSCVTPVSVVEGRDVRTIEGLATEAGLHPVQRAWLAEDVVQCGYCQPGQLMSAAAMLSRNTDPSDEDIDRAMSGNICRCGTYGRIRSAIKRAARILRDEPDGP